MNELLDPSIAKGVQLHTVTNDSQDQKLLELRRNGNALPKAFRKLLFGHWFACTGNGIRAEFDGLRAVSPPEDLFRVDLLEAKYLLCWFENFAETKMELLDQELSQIKHDARCRVSIA